VHTRPTHIIHLGDHFDLSSLGQYDYKKSNKHTFEGAELDADIKAGRRGLSLLLGPLRRLQAHQRASKKKVYSPVVHMLIGNHEERLLRFPELRGLIGFDDLFDGFGMEVHEFLKPLKLGGVSFVHYAYNPLSGRPLGGTAEFRLAKLKRSFVQGHEQVFKYAIDYIDDRAISALVCGACYLHDEGYKGPQGNNHFRGAVMLHNVKNGMYDLEQYSVERLMNG
jgi:hypothetical protein